jgi:hypothetical protein
VPGGELVDAGEQLLHARPEPFEHRALPSRAAHQHQLLACIDELAARHGAVVVDLYGAPALSDPRLWDMDRLHLTGEGHRRVAEAVWQTLGYEPEDPQWHVPPPASLPPGWVTRRVADVRFARQHLLPWIGRRLTGRSSGDGRPPKRPELMPYLAEATE